jgi:succinate dehydrogenase flavin-adding protein (antitoxin of CptAB toxin-antitoxin module)
MSERVWDHMTQRTFADFSARLESTDDKLTKLLNPAPAAQEQSPRE